MATLPYTTHWLRRGAFAAGLVAAITVVAIGRIPAATGTLGLDATVTSGPTGELTVAPAGQVARATGLQPGSGQLAGSVAVRNQTDAAVSIRVRMRPSISDADAALRVRVSGPRGVLYAGPAGGLREPSGGALELAPRAGATLTVNAWLPQSTASGWRGRNVTLPLEYVASIHGKVRR